MSVIVIEFITLDGIVSDPDGSGGAPVGGWAFRPGPDAVSSVAAGCEQGRHRAARHQRRAKPGKSRAIV